MPIPDLPGEITDRIISNVWPDIRSLLNCALVCSRWLPASRHHLFAELRSPSKKSYDLLVSRVLHSESMRPCLASVRSVELIEGRIGERWDPLPPEEKIGHLFIRDFVGHLPNFPWLWKLDLFDCKFPSFAALRQMLSALPALSSLMINDVYWPASTHPHPASTLSPDSRPSLETLYFVLEGVNHCAREFMDWLVQTASRSSIRQLEGSSTQELTFRLDRLSSMSDFTNIKHLSIDILDNMHGLPNWPGIVQLLQALRCPLYTLAVAFSYTSPPHFSHSYIVSGRDIRDHEYTDGMEVLDAVLEHKRFEKLKTMTFSLWLVLVDEDVSLASRPAHTQEGLNEIIQRKLPKLTSRVNAKGLVHVRTIPVRAGA